ncbi:MAG: adenylyltransferase/cytidyltransferase family protein, partial [Alistipes sp.]|nr:adenylyltransferase/cytidyltransferase family protein [Alistipes sp.]
MQTAICPGSFDPITKGHLDVIKRASRLFDRVVVCVVYNANKHSAFTLEERMEHIRRVTEDYDNVDVDCWDNLLVNYA